MLAAAVALFSLASGCALPDATAKRPAWEPWSQQRGGVVEPVRAGAEDARIAGAMSVLANAHTGSPVSIRMLDDEAVEAFIWPDGSLFVTRGLLAAMNREELTAALAHELGHLALRGDGRARVSGEEAEQLADRWGAALLERSGLPRGAMTDMLRKLQAHAHPEFRRTIDARIHLLQTPISPPRGQVELARVGP